MKRSMAFITMVTAGLALTAIVRAPATAETIAYVYAALPGPVDNCKWFDDNLNDHSEGSMIRLTDLLYNRAALTPLANVSVTQTETTARGDQVVQFDLHGRLLCAGATALHPEITEAMPTAPPP